MKYVLRIVNALLAAAIFPCVYFLEFVYFKISTSLADAGLQESVTIKFLVDVLTGKESFWANILPDSGSFSWPSVLDPIKTKLIACAVLFALALIAALFVFFWSIFSNKRIPVISASAFGIVCTVAMTVLFNSAADYIMSDNVNVVEIFSSSWLVSLLGNLISVDYIGLAGFQNAIIILFVAVIVWTLAFCLVELGEPKNEEKIKKH